MVVVVAVVVVVTVVVVVEMLRVYPPSCDIRPKGTAEFMVSR